MTIVKTPKKLIEVALPLDAINAAAAREKSIRHGHPSTLHLWWARRPLAAARAVLFAQMVNDPGYQQGGGFRYGVNKEKAAAERERLFKLIEELVQWESTNNEDVLERARAEIRRSWREVCELNKHHPQTAERFNPDKLPAFHDPFAGGGALPLEAQRLGLESYASDLNPVAVLINKAMIEIPPRFAGRAPISLGARASRPHKAWHSRGYLPHCDVPGLIQSITFRLDDSLPASALQQLQEQTEPDSPARRERLETLLHAGYGACWLAQPEIAAIVEDALLHFDGQRYRLLAWCVMPNHVHALIETRENFPLSDILHSWKSFTAKAINRHLQREGVVWHPDYYDRYIRDDAHLRAAMDYIESNPVQAGLVERKEDWRYGSAGKARQTARETRMLPGMEDWSGAKGLAEDVRRYGAWMRAEAERRIGHLYPQVSVVQEADGSYRHATEVDERAGRPRSQLTVIAWLWARTVKSPNPAFSHVDVPLASTFVLSSKPGKEAYVLPVVEGDRYRFIVRTAVSAGFQPAEYEQAKSGTAAGKRGGFYCLLSGSPIDYKYIRAEGSAGRMGTRLMAIVAEGKKGRVYLAPAEAHEAIARQAQPNWKPQVEICHWPGRTNVVEYGLTKYGDLFTPRQLVALTTFSDLVGEAIERCRQDALAAGLPDDGIGLDAGGTGATAYAQAVGVYLAFASNKVADRGSTLGRWDPTPTQSGIINTFSRQALPMTWDFAEANPLGDASGNYVGATELVAKALQASAPFVPGSALQADASIQGISTNKLVSTDPPYYDNIGYADLSDFFYVWLRRALRPIYPGLFATVAVPKAEELVATPYRHGGKEAAERFFWMA